MIRRSVLALLALAAASTLSSCATFERNDAVATVNGTELSRDDLADLLRNNVVQNQMIGPLDDDRATSRQADRMIGIWIAVTAVDQAGLADLAGTDEQAQLAAQYAADFTGAPAPVQQLLTRFAALRNQSETLDPTALHAAVQEADVHVDSRYGYWDEARSAVIPFGSPA